MARTCPLCGLAPREGDVMRPTRINTDEELIATKAPEKGLYSACEECQALHRNAGRQLSPEGRTETIATDGE